jgi:hypothetical protein
MVDEFDNLEITLKNEHQPSPKKKRVGAMGYLKNMKKDDSDDSVLDDQMPEQAIAESEEGNLNLKNKINFLNIKRPTRGQKESIVYPFDSDQS